MAAQVDDEDSDGGVLIAVVTGLEGRVKHLDAVPPGPHALVRSRWTPSGDPDEFPQPVLAGRSSIGRAEGASASVETGISASLNDM